MVWSPTYAPTLMNMGGMQVAPLPTKQPSRMLEPPGTMRTPLSEVMRLTGYVDLSKKGWRCGSMDMSVMAPMRKPRRMPFFTQPLTRQPDGDFSSGSAARTSPAFSASLNDWKSARCAGRYFSGGWSKICSMSCSICCCSMHLPQESNGFEYAANFLQIFCFGSDERETPDRFEQAHFGHGGFGRAGIRFDEIHLH